jgi:hypothetical protein
LLTTLKITLNGALVLLALFFAFALGHLWQWLGMLALLFVFLGEALLSRWMPIARWVRDPFPTGMFCFALAQASYAAGLWRSLYVVPTLHALVPGMPVGLSLIASFLPIALLAAVLSWVLLALRSGAPGILRWGALPYGALSWLAMAFACAAAFTGADIIWQLPLGALLWLLADGVLAAHLFRDRFPHETGVQWFTWFLRLSAQTLLLIGLFFLR